MTITTESFVATVLRELAGADTKKEGAYTMLFKGAKAHTAASFESICAEAEERFKEATSASRMPSSWRSAKSNILWGLKTEDNGQALIMSCGSYAELLKIRKALGQKEKAEETAEKAADKVADAISEKADNGEAIATTNEAAIEFLVANGGAIGKLLQAIKSNEFEGVLDSCLDSLIAIMAEAKAGTVASAPAKKARAPKLAKAVGA